MALNSLFQDLMSDRDWLKSIDEDVDDDDDDDEEKKRKKWKKDRGRKRRQLGKLSKSFFRFQVANI